MKKHYPNRPTENSIVEREDLFVGIVNRHADQVKAENGQNALISAYQKKSARDAAFGFAGITALAVSLVYGITQIL